jgi:hypothetical protein
VGCWEFKSRKMESGCHYNNKNIKPMQIDCTGFHNHFN